MATGPHYRLSPHKGAWLCLLALLCPPMTVTSVEGCNSKVAINCLLTLFGWIPGMVHAYYVVCQHSAIHWNDAHMLAKLERAEAGGDVIVTHMRPVATLHEPAHHQAMNAAVAGAAPSGGARQPHAIHAPAPGLIHMSQSHAQTQSPQSPRQGYGSEVIAPAYEVYEDGRSPTMDHKRSW